MSIRTYGTDARLAFCREYLLGKNIRSLRDVALLPIPTTRDGVSILGTGKSVSELLWDVGKGAVAVGYAIPKEMKIQLAELGFLTVDVSLDERFVLDNAVLTAVGTLGRILADEKAAPSELSIGIIGYGRIGRELLRLLMFLGSWPMVFTTREAVRCELGAIGVFTASASVLSDTTEIDNIKKLDIIINTAPTPLMSEEVIAGLDKTKIIELASGNNFPIGAEVLRYMSIPACMYPKSAGRVLAQSVLRMIGEEE